MVKISPLSSKECAHADSVVRLFCFIFVFVRFDATGSLDETVTAWKASDSGEIEKKEDYIGHTLGAVSVAASESGLVASSALDSMIRVWELESSETRTSWLSVHQASLGRLRSSLGKTLNISRWQVGSLAP